MDINAKNENDVAPIHIAAKYEYSSLVNLLLEKKVNYNARCNNLTKSHNDNIGKGFPIVMDYISVQSGDINNSTVNANSKFWK
jgi:ankyrin repeat protein